MVYAWGLSILLTGMIYALDSSEWLPDYLKPGVGTITCFLNSKKYVDLKHFVFPLTYVQNLFLGKHRLAQFLYYFLPMYILIILNTGFFVVAAIKIRSIQNDVNRMGSKEAGSQERTKRQKDIEKYALKTTFTQKVFSRRFFNHFSFVLFFRLFVVMGMGWLEEPISYLIPGNSHWFIIVEIFNVLIGVWIFILFVLKRRVLQLIRNRFVCDDRTSWRNQNAIAKLFRCIRNTLIFEKCSFVWSPELIWFKKKKSLMPVIVFGIDYLLINE